jgi:NitT/TauT family transport system ATP-binding protein
MPNSIITFTHIFKAYQTGQVLALDDLSISIREGEFFVIVGPSGCGKSTVLKIIAGLEKETGGVLEKPDDISMVFQSGALFPWLSVLDNVALPLRVKNIPEKQVREISLHFINMAGLKDFAEKYPRDLSGGQRQRVGIARALAVSPKVLLLDEPFSALDTVTTEDLHKDLLKIWEQTKQTIVMVSHSIEEAVTLADRIMLMKSGKLEEIFNIPLSRPRREQQDLFIRHVHAVRRKFFE